MKKIAFWISTPVIFLAAVICGCISTVGSIFNGTSNVVAVLCDRWEYWCAGIPKGYYLNCPWKKSIIDVFCDEFK